MNHEIVHNIELLISGGLFGIYEITRLSRNHNLKIHRRAVMNGYHKDYDQMAIRRK